LLDKNARGVKESMNALSAIASFCRDRGIGFVTFYYRSKRRPLEGLFSELQSIGQTHGFSVVDVAPWWADVDIRSVTNSTIDPHPNERGHELLATGMADFLMTHGLVNKTAAASR
jgi:hypothetical protein